MITPGARVARIRALWIEMRRMLACSTHRFASDVYSVSMLACASNCCDATTFDSVSFADSAARPAKYQPTPPDARMLVIHTSTNTVHSLVGVRWIGSG